MSYRASRRPVEIVTAIVLIVMALGTSPGRAGQPSGGGAVGSLDRLLEYGITLALSGQPTAADSVFTSVLSSAPGDARALNNLGNLSLVRGDTDVALAFYDRAGRADSADAGIWLNRSVALLLSGNAGAAQVEARRALAQAGGPGSAQALMGLRETSPRGPDAKATMPTTLSREELLALLAAAADTIPSDRAAAGDSLKAPAATASRVPGRLPIWRSAGPRAAERTDLSLLLYWKW